MVQTDGEINAQVRGLSRVKILSFESHEAFFLARVEEIPEVIDDAPESIALYNHLKNEFRRAMSLGKSTDFLLFMNIMSENSHSELADLVASALDIKPQERQELLEMTNVKERLQKIADYLAQEMKVLELERRIASKTQERFEKGAREAMLRERLKTIKHELNEMGDEEEAEVKELLRKIKEAKMSEDVEEKARKEVKKLQGMNQYNPEAGYIRNYLDWLISVPWSVQSKNTGNIKSAEKILDEDHYGLQKVKERIVEYLAVHKLAGKIKGPILCFVGPPGVGKTSIGKSIARALDRKFVRVSLGGIRD